MYAYTHLFGRTMSNKCLSNFRPMSTHNAENAHNDTSSKTKGAIVQEKLFDTKRNACPHDVMRLFDDVTMDFKDQRVNIGVISFARWRHPYLQRRMRISYDFCA